MPKYYDHSDNESDDESFVRLGTPLPVYAQDEVPLRKPVALHDQSVRDAEGRVRFHGAFTGGFSAGYFNSVSTKEGWAPKGFVSSRSQRAGASEQGQKPEDFMDEEDFSEFGIAPKKIATTDTFRDVDHRALKISNATDGLATQYLADLVQPKRFPIGMKLLRKLGWRDGQGIGPRIKRKRHRKAEPSKQKAENSEESSSTKVYGCSLPSEFNVRQDTESEDSFPDDSAFPETATFAPKDVCPINFTSKSNYHGIGYRGLNPKMALGHVTTIINPVASTTGKRGIRGQAFGVGALEDEDEDIYSMDSIDNYDRQLGGPEPDLKHSYSSVPSRISGAKGPDIKAIGSSTETVLAGFHKMSVSTAAELQLKKINYAPPQVPKGYRPFHTFASDINSYAGTATNTNTGSSTAVCIGGEGERMGGGRKKLDAHDRGSLLGESPHLNSIFELVSGEDRARMEAAKMSMSLQQAQREKTAVSQTASHQTEMRLLPIDPTSSLATEQRVENAEPGTSSSLSSASASLRSVGGFKPFAKNPAKQKRYEEYLEATKYGKHYVPDESVVSHMTEWEKDREREEFIQAARLYRPLSNMMTSRFTRAKYDDDDKEKKPEDELEKSVQDKAAEMKMFGKLTREKFEWHPDRTLCKRFNIANPYPDSQIVGLLGVKRDKCSVFNFLTFPSEDEQKRNTDIERREETEKKKTSTDKETAVRAPKPLAILSSVDLRPGSSYSRETLTSNSSSTGGDNLSGPAATILTTVATSVSELAPMPLAEGERPPIDFFKAIFEASDVESNESSPDEKEDEQERGDEPTEIAVRASPESQRVADMEDIVKQSSSSSNSAQGLLMNTEVESTNPRCCERTTSADVTGDVDLYGPALPPPSALSSGSNISSRLIFQSAGSDPHRHSLSSSRHKHSKSKAKSHKSKKSKSKKSKHKKKKHRSKSSTKMADSSSSGSEADSELETDEENDNKSGSKSKPENRESCSLSGDKKRPKASDYFS